MLRPNLHVIFYFLLYIYLQKVLRSQVRAAWNRKQFISSSSFFEPHQFSCRWCKIQRLQRVSAEYNCQKSKIQLLN